MDNSAGKTSKSEDIDEFWQDQFNRGKHPTFWAINAQSSLHASNVLFDRWEQGWNRFKEQCKSQEAPAFDVDMELCSPGFLLLGYAIEALSKGVIVNLYQDILETRDGRNILFGHNLAEKVINTGIQITDEETFLLNQLTRVVLWRGRYPVPKSLEEWQLVRGTDGIRYMPGQIGPLDRHKFDRIINELNDRLRDAMKSHSTRNRDTRESPDDGNLPDLT